MAIRLVPKQIARSAADAEASIIRDSGGAVVPTGNTKEIGDGASAGWAVEVFSADGLASLPAAAGRTVFTAVSVSEDGETATLRDHAGFHFKVSRILPEFLGSTLTLQVGQRLSGVLLGHSVVQDLAVVKDALIEDDLKERREFESAGDGQPGARAFGAPYPNTHGRTDCWEPKKTPPKPAGTPNVSLKQDDVSYENL